MTTALFALLALPFYALAAGGHAEAPKGPTGWEALSALQTGNMRFYEGHPSHLSQDPARRELLAGGQHPHTIVVSCSDSRVPPETVFDQGLGEIFTVRLAGHAMTAEAIASIEYAVAHLGPKLLLVMGHESCGAVGAAVASSPSKSNGSESLDVLVRQIRANLSEAAVSSAATDKTLRVGVKENVTASLRILLQRSAIVRDAVAKGGLILGQAVYGLRSGRVEFWDVGRNVDFDNLADRPVVREQTVKEEVIAPDVVAPKVAKPKKKAAKAAPPPAADAHGHPPVAPASAPAHAAPAPAAAAHDDHHGASAPAPAHH